MPPSFHLRCATRFLAPEDQVRDLTTPDGPWMAWLREKAFIEWRHERIWETATDAVRYADSLTFTPVAGKLQAIAVERLLQRHHRHLASQLPSDARATAVSTLRVNDDVEDEGNSGYM